MSFAQLERTFARALGPGAVPQLLRSAAPHPCVITVGGDQLTGKSTLVRDLAASRALGAALAPPGLDEDEAFRLPTSAVRSTGETMRLLAAEHGVSTCFLAFWHSPAFAQVCIFARTGTKI